MKLNIESQNSLTNAIKEALKRYQGNGDQQYVTDIHLQPNAFTGELVIYNDDDDILAQASIPEWEGYPMEGFYADVESFLREELMKIQKEVNFQVLRIFKPFSFVLIGDDKETITELLLVDDEETLLVSDELLKGLDEELDAFLKDLLEK